MWPLPAQDSKISFTVWTGKDLYRAAPAFLFWSHLIDRLLWYAKGNLRPVITLVPTWPVTEPPNCRGPECRLLLSQSFQDGEPFSPTGHLLQMADQQLPRHNGRPHRLRVRQVSYCEQHSPCTVHVLFAGANVRGLSIFSWWCESTSKDYPRNPQRLILLRPVVQMPRMCDIIINNATILQYFMHNSAL